jgi:signal transduction histidine kinase
VTDGRDSPAFRVLSDVVLVMAAEREVEPVLQRLVHAARELGGARYAALGVPDGEGAFARFITSGMSEALNKAMGPLPRTHGLLGAMLESPQPYRIDDIHRDPRFRGWWPSAHPDMRSFLGVPIVAPVGVIGAFYLTEKLEGAEFTEEDEELIGLLAAHAAIAIANARLYEQTRELSIVAERNRLALDLHDAVSQKLFGLVLEAEGAATVLERDPAAAGERVAKLQVLAREALDELRSLVFELRPPELEKDGLGGTLQKHIDVLGRLGQEEIELVLAGELPTEEVRDREVFRIAQEALQNVLKHAQAQHVVVRLGAGDGTLFLEVEDDGIGFDPDAPETRSRRLGLTSMEERAHRLGGTVQITSVPGAGTTVRVEAPDR